MCYMLDRCEQKVRGVILPKDRDPRFVTIRRGGTLTDSDHQLLALWAASCAEHVLDLFESARPEDPRPRHAIEQARAWVRGEITMSQARTAAGHANAAARDLSGAGRHAAHAAGQAAAVAHVAAHETSGSVAVVGVHSAGAPPKPVFRVAMTFPSSCNGGRHGREPLPPTQRSAADTPRAMPRQASMKPADASAIPPRLTGSQGQRMPG